MTPDVDRSTLIHEAGHTFNLAHSFVPRDGVIFDLFGGVKVEQGTSDNIMDYGYNPANKAGQPAAVPVISNMDKISLWKFQWESIQKDPNLKMLQKK